MDELYFGILEQECIQSAMTEYRIKIENLGNRPRAALVKQLQDKLDRLFASQG